MFIRKVCSAFTYINRKLCMIKPQLFRTDLMEPSAQTDDLRGREKLIAACNNKVYVLRQAFCKSADKIRNTIIA